MKRKKRLKEEQASDSEDERTSKKPKTDSAGKRGTSFDIGALQKCDWSNLSPFRSFFWRGECGSDSPSDDIKMLRKNLGILVKGALRLCPPPIKDTTDTGLPDKFITEFFKYRSLQRPSPIQSQCWPAIFSSASLLAIAPTGSGKTLAFSLPLMTHIKAQEPFEPLRLKGELCVAPVGLVVVPTRELAVQVLESIKKPFAKLAQLSCAAIYGGQNMDDVMDNIRLASAGISSSGGSSISGGAHVAICTPGRLLELLIASKMSLRRVTYMVLDEADRMLALGFTEQLDAIASQVRPDRQTLLFSATFPGKLREAATKWVTGDSVFIRCNAMEVVRQEVDDAAAAAAATAASASEGIENAEPSSSASASACTAASSTSVGSVLTINRSIVQEVHVCAAHKKPRLLIKYILAKREQEQAEKCRQHGAMLIFCTKIKTLKFVWDFLLRHDVKAEMLHGQLPQERREQVLSNFKAVSQMTDT